MPILISTVLNEAFNIKKLLQDINKQTLTPSEVIIVDAGSTDGTCEILKNKVTLITKKGAGRSEGRNIAIAHADSKDGVIAVCDAGTTLSKTWFEKITKPLLEDPTVDVACGFFKPDVSNFFETCLASATIPILPEIEEASFLPSSRSLAIRKDSWEKVGGYPEWLPICEDLVFDIKLKLAGFKFKFIPDAIVYWKPRKDLKSFFKQYYLYAKGDGHAKLWLVRHLIRYSAYITGFLFISLAINDSALWLLPFFAAQLGYFSKFYYRYMEHFPDLPEYLRIFAFPYISFLVITGDIAKMLGYPIGIYERQSGKIKFESYR